VTQTTMTSNAWMSVCVSMLEGCGDTDYNDVQCLDESGSTLNGEVGVSSSAAINDNLLNAQRQLHRDGSVNSSCVI